MAINGNVSHQSNGEVTVDGVVQEAGTVEAARISVSGMATGSNYNPAPQHQTPVLDPLAELQLPADFSSMSSWTTPAATGPVSTAPSTSRTLPTASSPRALRIAGEWKLAGTERLAGTGVTRFFPCGTPVAGDRVPVDLRPWRLPRRRRPLQRPAAVDHRQRRSRRSPAPSTLPPRRCATTATSALRPRRSSTRH